MAIGMLTVLKTIPWADVIGAAPGVVGGAKKLWDAVANKPQPQGAEATAGGPETISSLSARLADAEVAMADFHQQLVSATAIISSLAEQNANLIAKVDVARKQILALAGIVAVSLILAASSVVMLLVRS